ncbi:hypothetical protein J4731_02865 [Providencia rettgeri]|nr:hypothetical protein [Providencia rettgeri]
MSSYRLFNMVRCDFIFRTQAINAIIEIVTGVSMFWVIFITYASLQLFNASRNVDSM